MQYSLVQARILEEHRIEGGIHQRGQNLWLYDESCLEDKRVITAVPHLKSQTNTLISFEGWHDQSHRTQLTDLTSLAKTVFSVRNKLPATSALSKKKINGEEDEKIKFDPKIIPPRKSYSRHFEIVIALKKFTISSFK